MIKAKFCSKIIYIAV